MSAPSELELYALSAAVPTYGLGHQDHEIERGKSRLRSLFGSDVTTEFDPTPARRFAGDRTLPRSRYFSLLDDLFDHRTLLGEVSAYLIGSTYLGLVSLFDTEGTNTIELLAILAAIPKQNYQALNLRVPSLLVAFRPLTSDPVLRDAYGEGSHYVVQVPYAYSSREIQKLIDLRRPAARRWLVEQFKRTVELDGIEFPVLLGRKGPAGFSQLLPSLLDQWQGGGWSTSALTGIFARQAGASGIIYPSARNNPWVQVEDGLVRDSSGWCLVLYADAPKMEITHAVSAASDQWPSMVGYAPDNYSWVEKFIPAKGVAIEYLGSGSRVESFFVTGLAEYNRAIYRLSQVTTVLKAIDSDLGSSVSSRLSYNALFSAPTDIVWLASRVMSGLLGNVKSVAALETAKVSGNSERYRETLADIQRLVARSPRSFQATGVLAESLTAAMLQS